MNTISYPSAEATAKKLAERIQQEVEKSEVYYLALTGGFPAIPLYQALANTPTDQRDWPAPSQSPSQA